MKLTRREFATTAAAMAGAALLPASCQPAEPEKKYCGYWLLGIGGDDIFEMDEFSYGSGGGLSTKYRPYIDASADLFIAMQNVRILPIQEDELQPEQRAVLAADNMPYRSIRKLAARCASHDKLVIVEPASEFKIFPLYRWLTVQSDSGLDYLPSYPFSALWANAYVHDVAAEEIVIFAKHPVHDPIAHVEMFVRTPCPVFPVDSCGSGPIAKHPATSVLVHRGWSIDTSQPIPKWTLETVRTGWCNDAGDGLIATFPFGVAPGFSAETIRQVMG